MSLALEKMFDSFMLRKVPELWENVAYPSLKPLGAWVADLIARIAFMKEWVEKD
jgi:dynein heavy chain